MIRLEMCPCHFSMQMILLTDVSLDPLSAASLKIIFRMTPSIYLSTRFSSLYLYTFTCCVCVCLFANKKVGAHNIIVLLENSLSQKNQPKDPLGSVTVMEAQ